MTSSKSAPRVLVVDDEEGIRVFLETVLVDMGCDVLCAPTAEDAWRKIREQPSLDLILLDKNLPDRSGLSLLEEAKTLDPDLEVVIITAYASMDSVVTALRRGAGDFLAKPFDDLGVLQGKLESALERGRRARERTALTVDLTVRETSLEREVFERTAELTAAWETLRRREREQRRLMANVAHDLRAPLTAIQCYLEHMIEGGVDADSRERHLRTMWGQCQRLRRLAGDVSFMARQEDNPVGLAMATLDTSYLFDLAAGEMEPVLEQAELALIREVAPGAEHVRGDQDRLMQVLTNLLGNAAKFAPARSTVRMTAEPREGSILLSVSDEGAGVPPAQRESVFERYQSVDLRGRGEGIGLSICQEITLAHGGRIWVEDSEQGGARFQVLLPLGDERAAAGAAGASAV